MQCVGLTLLEKNFLAHLYYTFEMKKSDTSIASNRQKWSITTPEQLPFGEKHPQGVHDKMRQTNTILYVTRGRMDLFILQKLFPLCY